MAKQKKDQSKPSLIRVRKEGFPDRHFTMQQLENMGRSQDGTNYDGWHILEGDVKTPDELNQVKATKKAGKNDSKIVKLNKSENDEQVDAGKSEGAAQDGDGRDADSQAGADSAPGSVGDQSPA